jgi:mono/diheme cytochrome c family protein
VLALAGVARGAEKKPDAKQIERGRYLAVVGNCNDCHTAGFAPKNGEVPEKEWLTGDPDMGLAGPWGTTYPTNLRRSLSKMTESQWLSYAKALKARPPMPWFGLNKWKDEDLRAFYQFVRHLGPAGQPSRPAAAPGAKPGTAVIQWPAPPAK